MSNTKLLVDAEALERATRELRDMGEAFVHQPDLRRFAAEKGLDPDDEARRIAKYVRALTPVPEGEAIVVDLTTGKFTFAKDHDHLLNVSLRREVDKLQEKLAIVESERASLQSDLAHLREEMQAAEEESGADLSEADRARSMAERENDLLRAEIARRGVPALPMYKAVVAEARQLRAENAQLRAMAENPAAVEASLNAPTCPDCDQPCVHPLAMLVECGRCQGTGKLRTDRPEYVACSDCNGTGKVAPPLPTDEQIFGRKCEQCHGSGKWSRAAFPVMTCFTCSGTGRVGAAENRWVCLGQAQPTHCRRCGHPVGDHIDSGCEKCHCHWSQEECSFANPCPGRHDVVADAETWRAAIRGWRTRTKTTVLRRGNFWDDGKMLGYEIPGDEDDRLVPELPGKGPGSLTVMVTYVPEDER